MTGPIRIETKLVDLLVDHSVKELTQALMYCAQIEGDAKAIVALLWATTGMMHRQLLDTFKHDPQAAETNRRIYITMLESTTADLKASDLARLTELMDTTLVKGPRRLQ